MSENVNEYDEMWDEGKKKNEKQSQRVEFNENNYLNTRLKPGETKRQIKIRLLTTRDIDGKMKIAIPVEVHSLKLNNEQQKLSKSGFKSFICLNDEHIEGDDRGCPLCNKKQEIFNEVNRIKKRKAEITNLINSGNLSEYDKGKLEAEFAAYPNDDEIKAMSKEAFRYSTKTAYIVRCIERGHEDEGVKFWRFNKHDDGSGPYDVLYSLGRNRMQESIDAGLGSYNMYNYTDGLDLTLTLTQAEKKTPGAPDKTSITIDASSIRTPLSKDPELAESWINDSKDWRDMYRSKSYEYLKIVGDGKSPVFKDGKWVAWVDMTNDSVKAEEEAKKELKDTSVPTVPTNVKDEEELPF